MQDIHSVNRPISLGPGNDKNDVSLKKTKEIRHNKTMTTKDSETDNAKRDTFQFVCHYPPRNNHLAKVHFSLPLQKFVVHNSVIFHNRHKRRRMSQEETLRDKNKELWLLYDCSAANLC